MKENYRILKSKGKYHVQYKSFEYDNYGIVGMFIDLIRIIIGKKPTEPKEVWRDFSSLEYNSLVDAKRYIDLLLEPDEIIYP